MFKIGYGEDIHILKEGKKLYLGSVLIDEHIGCVAHSDGDVLLHSLVDALLGAMGLGDIGEHFSDKDPQYKDKESSYFIKKTMEFVDQYNYEIVNVDALIILEKIKIKDFKPSIKKAVANLLGIDESLVNIKAGTNEKMDAVGEGKCVIAKTVVLLRKKD